MVPLIIATFTVGVTLLVTDAGMTRDGILFLISCIMYCMGSGAAQGWVFAPKLMCPEDSEKNAPGPLFMNRIVNADPGTDNGLMTYDAWRLYAFLGLFGMLINFRPAFPGLFLAAGSFMIGYNVYTSIQMYVITLDWKKEKRSEPGTPFYMDLPFPTRKDEFIAGIVGVVVVMTIIIWG